jgi:hypothetical protein
MSLAAERPISAQDGQTPEIMPVAANPAVPKLREDADGTRRGCAGGER